jgi:hypothetical protein
MSRRPEWTGPPKSRDDRLKGRATVHAGAATRGSNNFAELAPYVHALWHHRQDHCQAPTTPVEVVIIGVSELTVRLPINDKTLAKLNILREAADVFRRGQGPGADSDGLNVPLTASPSCRGYSMRRR